MIAARTPSVSSTFLFDVDGTLVWYRGIGQRALERAIFEEWGTPDALAHVSFAGATDHGLLAAVADGRAPGAVWERYARHLEQDMEALADAKPLPGVNALLDRLAASGARLGLLTGNLRTGARAKLGRSGLWARFDPAISAFGDDGVQRVQIAAAARARCGACSVTVIGDSLADAVCARHIGARVLLVNTGPQARSELEQCAPDRLLEDLSATDDVCDWLLSPP